MLISSGITARNTNQMNLKKIRTRLRASSQAQQDRHQLSRFLQKQDGKLYLQEEINKISHVLMQIRNFTTIPFYHLSSEWNEFPRD